MIENSYARLDKNGKPICYVKCSTAEEALQFRNSATPVGSFGSLKGPLVIFSGELAVEVAKKLGCEIARFSDWKPKLSVKVSLLPDSYFIADSLQFLSRSEWQHKSNSAYQQVFKKRRHLIPACTQHMTSCDPFKQGYQIYAYEFPTKFVYVGLTCNPTRRHKGHAVNGPVFEKTKEGIKPVLRVLESGLMPTSASEAEIAAIQKYKDEGWSLLNTDPGGSLGQIRSKYTYQQALREASSCHSKNELNKLKNDVYQVVSHQGWLQKLAKELGWPEHMDHWTFEECLQEARPLKGRGEWAVKARNSYCAAIRNGWLETISKEMGWVRIIPKSKWTRELIEKRAKDFKCRSEWQYGCHDSSYTVARKTGILNEVSAATFGHRRNRWDFRQNAAS
jgi:hypothetical protein